MFSLMNIIFFNDTGNVILKRIFRQKIIFAFLTEGYYHICMKKKSLLYQT